MGIERDVDMVGVRLVVALDFRVEGEAMGAHVNTSLRWLRLGPMRCVAHRLSEENKDSINFQLNIICGSSIMLARQVCRLK